MKRFACIIITLLVLASLLALPSNANSAEQPSLIVLVIGAPDDLELYIDNDPDDDIAPVKMLKTKSGWESCFRFYRHEFPGNIDLETPLLTAKSGGEEKSEVLSNTHLKKMYSNLVTLDYDTMTVTSDQPAWRIPMLVSMRVLLTLVIEGAVFFLFGYRKKRSWVCFLCLNLVTQAALNLTITGPIAPTYWMFGFIFGEAVIFVVESIVMCRFVTEHKRERAVLYALSANALSLVLGGLLINYLPV